LEETIRIPFDIGDFKNKALMCISCDPDYTSKKKKKPTTCPEKDLKNTNAKGIYFYRFFWFAF